MSNDTSKFPLYEEEHAYSMGIQAFVFTFPLSIAERERKVRLDPNFCGQEGIAPVARINDIGHMDSVATSDDVLPYTPNNDTIYSGGFIEVVDEPMIFTAPDISDRYWSVEFANGYLENVFYIGSRATNGKGGNYAIVGPNWKGRLPDDVTECRMEYNTTIFALRIAVSKKNKYVERQETMKVRELQKDFYITSLSNWGKSLRKGRAAVPDSITQRPEYTGPLSYFQTVADLMIENPPTAVHNAQVEPFHYIGLVPGEKFDPSTLTEPVKLGLARAAAMGPHIMDWKVKFRGTAYTTRWNKLQEGTYGHLYLDRAAGANEGLFVHDYVEATYYSTYESCNVTESGKPVDGTYFNSSNKYQITIPKKRLPKVNEALHGFWSFTMYGPDFQLVANQIRRFALSYETVEADEDGTVTLYFQATNPALETDVFKTKEEQHRAHKNWLPCPSDPEQLFRVNYRMYLPMFTVRNPKPVNRFIPPIVLRE